MVLAITWLLGHRKPCCFWPFFDDELNPRVAEHALQRTKLAKESDTFLCWYREGTQAIGAGDYVVLSIAGHPNRSSVPLYCRARRSVTQQLGNLCQELLQPERFGEEGICEHAERFDRRVKFSAYGNRRDLREAPARNR